MYESVNLVLQALYIFFTADMIILGFFLLFAACSALGLIAGTATALIFVAMGYSIIGPFMIVLGCALIAIVVTAALFQFVFGKGGAKQA